MKVKNLANELGKKPKEFIRILYDLDIKVKSENTKLDDDIVDTIKDLLSPKKSKKTTNSNDKKTAKLTTSQLTIAELSEALDVPLKSIMAIVMKKGLLLNLNSIIDLAFAKDIATDLNITINDASSEEISEEVVVKAATNTKDNNESTLKFRPPIVTVMGHVDHGKTSLLDFIRKKNVVDTESGGITQHIGAYQVRLDNKKKITFLDTPGHEAFTALRARGTSLTDIVILVVAANDGLKPQTIEAINHSKAAKTPIIIAINKIDLPGADIESVKQQLVEYDLVPEEWGGQTIICPISAKTGDGIDHLLEMISLNAEILELKTNYDCQANGPIIEAFLDKKRGPICTVMIQEGTLTTNNHIAIGNIYGKARALFNDTKSSISKALPSTPVEILGLSAVPRPGDMLKSFTTESEAKQYISEQKSNDTSVNQKVVKTIGMTSLSQQVNAGDVKKLNLIVKADVHGSLDAIIYSIQKIESDEISIDILHSGTGNITENDALLAKASNAIVFAFRVSATNDAKKLFDTNKMVFKKYDIIYEILDDIRDIMSGLTITAQEETVIGSAEVREIFNFSKIGTIAGSYVNSGYLLRNNTVKVIRNNDQIFEGKLTSLKRFKDDVKKVNSGYECGIVVDKFPEFKQGDIIECYGIEK